MSTAPSILPASPASSAVDPLASLSDAQRAEVGRRLQILDAWRACVLAHEAKGFSDAAAMRWFLADKSDLSGSTLYRWQRLLDDEGPLGLADGRRVCHRPPADACSVAAWEFFKGLWLTIHRRSVSLCHQMTAFESERNGWTWPSLRTIQARVKRDLPPFLSDYHRYGEREWRRRHEPKIKRDISAYRSGQCWVGDFHEFDVFCRRSETDPMIVRPLLSAFLDMRSRVLVGWHISERECQDTVLLALRRGIEQYGPPAELVIDNGKPYRARGVSGGRPGKLIDDEDYVRSVLGSLNIETHFSIPFNPNSKPVEGWFGVLESQFGATFSSYCGGDKDDRFRAASALAKAHPELCPTIAEFTEKFAQWLTAYHATPSRGELDGMTPAEAWASLDPIARRILPDGALDILLMRVTDPVSVRCGLVVCDTVQYYDSRLLPMNGTKVRLRRDSEDASFVLICDLDGHPLFRAVNYRLSVMGVTRDDVADAMREKRHSRKVVRAMHEGAGRAALQDVSDLAIQARMAAGKPDFMDKLALATGTDGRTVAPLRSDFATAVERYSRTERAAQASALVPAAEAAGHPAPTPKPKRRSLADMIQTTADAEPAPEPPPKRTLAEMLLASAPGGVA